MGMTHRLAKEVVGLGFDGGYFSETRDKWESGFGQWLRCYFKPGMSNIKDHNGRTMWFQGEAGPMAPAGAKRNVGAKTKKDADDVKSAKRVKKEKVEKEKVGLDEKKENIVKREPKKEKEDSKKVDAGRRRSARLAK